MFNITLIPNPNQENLTALEFTYNCTHFSDKLMKIQLTFENGRSISANGVDRLMIEIVNNTILQGRDYDFDPST